MPYGIPYGNGDVLAAMSGIASGRPRRRMGPMPGDLVDLPGTIGDPVLPTVPPIMRPGRMRTPGRRRQQDIIPIVPPFTDPIGPGFTDPTAVGPNRRRPRRPQYPVNLTPQPTLPQIPMPTLPQFPVTAPQFPTNPGTGNLPGMGAMDLFGRGGFGFGG